MTRKELYEKIRKEVFGALVPPIDCWMENDMIRARAKGVRGRLFQPLLDYSLERLNNNKVIGKWGGANVYTLYNPPMPSPAGIRLVEGRLKEKLFNIITPTTVTYAVTYACPCNCEFCSADRFNKARGGSSDRKVLNTDEAKRAIDACVDLGCTNITFTGGEPMTRKDFFELVEHVPKDKAIALMFTSGFYLNEENAARLKEAGIYSVMVSLDSINPETHEKFRRTPGLFNRAWEGAKLLRDAGVLVGISTHASHENIADGSLELLLRKAGDEGFNEITIFDSMPTGKWLHNESVILTPDERRIVLDLAGKYARMEGGPGVIAQSWINSPIGSGCFAGFFQFYLSAYGDVNPCDFHPITFGNIRDKPLEELWEDMISHPEYKVRKWNCRMQSPAFRDKYIKKIPDDCDLPVSIDFFGTVSEAAPDVGAGTETVGGGRRR